MCIPARLLQLMTGVKVLVSNTHEFHPKLKTRNRPSLAVNICKQPTVVFRSKKYFVSGSLGETATDKVLFYLRGPQGADL